MTSPRLSHRASLVARALVIAALAVALGAVAPRLAAAQDAPTAEQLAQAKQAFLDGRALHDKGDLAGAVEKFKESFRLSRNPVLLYNIAFTFEELGQNDLALFYYKKYLSDAPAADSQRPAAEASVKKLDKGAPATDGDGGKADGGKADGDGGKADGGKVDGDGGKADGGKPPGRKPKRTAFVLSGGGNLGALQVGMLRALFERRIRPDLVLGCSVGALNGAAIAAEPSLATVGRLQDLWRDIADQDVMPAGLLPTTVQLARKGVSLHENANLRRVIADIARDGGFPPLMLDPIDFGRLYSQNLAQGETTAQGQPN